MNKWLQRWQGMATRERWLTYGVALGLLGVLYVLLVGDPLSMRLAKQQSDWQVAEGRRAEDCLSAAGRTQVNGPPGA